MKLVTPISALAGLALAFSVAAVRAEITVGVTISATGPAASLGIPEKNTIALMPTSIGAEKVRYVVLDDGSDPSTAVKNARKLVSEEKADILIGSSTVPTSLALIEVAAETHTAMLALAPLAPPADKRVWAFAPPQTNALMASAVIEHMVKSGVKSMGFIGYHDAFGEGFWREVEPLAQKAGIKIVASERYNRTDTSVTGQVLKLVAAAPEAILIVGSGTPAALPQITLAERGYKGKIYQSHGAANRDFLRVGGKNVEGALIPVGPMLVAEQLPDTHPSKKVALDYVKAYEAAYGADSRSTFGGHTWDAGLLFQQAAAVALKKAKPGTPEFRQALRDALENTKNLAATHGVFNMSAADHTGLDVRSRVMVRIEGGNWKLVK